MRSICLLGSTGSIGTQTLEVVLNNQEELAIVSMVAGTNVPLFAEQIVKFHPKKVCMKNAEYSRELEDELRDRYKLNSESMPEILSGMDGIIECATMEEIDIVVAAMVGMIGLRPVISAIENGKDIALANKETLVTAGHLIMPLVKEHGVKLLPIDSEHSAIFQCMQSGGYDEIESLYLTASGGPFRHYSKDELENVTVEDALNHPNWSMGKKITIDSATMINKGLEIIEACHLFRCSIDKVKVVVQPKSLIHSMVGFQDGAIMAQIGTPDMKVPIQYALMYPRRPRMSGERVDFSKISSISFEEPSENLKGIMIAKKAFEIGGSMTTVMNAANEYAVAAFLDEKISFVEIYELIEYAMDNHLVTENPSLDDILLVEKETYEKLDSYLQRKI
ncbi:MAG: 1-deoxy-D-xylulose-5-phosphate reductoisomerase [Eubacterium sp.]|nr:1-deoxy-D-xylulose-5-phosphate reductoisomerase [Eubacterium sp.]